MDQEQTEASSTACSICLDAFQIGDELRGSNSPKCRHIFHSSCILKWLEQNDPHLVCPMCRFDFLGNSPTSIVVDAGDNHG